MSHPIIKVRTNCTKTLRAILGNEQLRPHREGLLGERLQELVGILEQNLLKNNFHLQT